MQNSVFSVKWIPVSGVAWPRKVTMEKNVVEAVKALSMKKNSSANVIKMVCNHDGSFIKHAPKPQKDLRPHVCH